MLPATLNELEHPELRMNGRKKGSSIGVIVLQEILDQIEKKKECMQKNEEFDE